MQHMQKTRLKTKIIVIFLQYLYNQKSKILKIEGWAYRALLQKE